MTATNAKQEEYISKHLLNLYAGINWGLIPSHMWPGVKQYYEYGLTPGDFLYLILEGDFRRAIFQADPANKASIVNWAYFLMDLPMLCHGSTAAVKAWIGMGGLRGYVASQSVEANNVEV